MVGCDWLLVAIVTVVVVVVSGSVGRYYQSRLGDLPKTAFRKLDG